MPEWMTPARPAPPGQGIIPEVLFLRLFIAFLMGGVVVLVHQLTRGRGAGKSDRSFLTTLVLLSVLIALVTIVINDDVARAFSLAGALAIIRFRTVVEDTRDTAFVIFAVVSGMAAGTGYLFGPVAATPFVLLAAWLLRPNHEAPPVHGTLVLRLAATRPPDEHIAALLKNHVGECRLSSVATARGGSAFDVTYTIRLPPPERLFALVNELSRVEGVQGVELKER